MPPHPSGHRRQQNNGRRNHGRGGGGGGAGQHRNGRHNQEGNGHHVGRRINDQGASTRDNQQPYNYGGQSPQNHRRQVEPHDPQDSHHRQGQGRQRQPQDRSGQQRQQHNDRRSQDRNREGRRVHWATPEEEERKSQRRQRHDQHQHRHRPHRYPQEQQQPPRQQQHLHMWQHPDVDEIDFDLPDDGVVPPHTATEQAVMYGVPDDPSEDKVLEDVREPTSLAGGLTTAPRQFVSELLQSIQPAKDFTVQAWQRQQHENPPQTQRPPRRQQPPHTHWERRHRELRQEATLAWAEGQQRLFLENRQAALYNLYLAPERSQPWQQQQQQLQLQIPPDPQPHQLWEPRNHPSTPLVHDGDRAGDRGRFLLAPDPVLTSFRVPPPPATTTEPPARHSSSPLHRDSLLQLLTRTAALAAWVANTHERVRVHEADLARRQGNRPARLGEVSAFFAPLHAATRRAAAQLEAWWREAVECEAGRGRFRAVGAEEAAFCAEWAGAVEWYRREVVGLEGAMDALCGTGMRKGGDGAGGGGGGGGGGEGWWEGLVCEYQRRVEMFGKGMRAFVERWLRDAA